MPAIYGIAGDILDRIEAERLRNLEPGTSKPVYTKKITLHFKREELLYDIKNIAFVEGDVMPTEDEHDKHQIMDICEDGNIDRVTRVMALALSQCEELLYPYSKKDVEQEEERNDILESPEEYVITLKVPDDFSKSTATYLERLIHEFLVYMVLSDWLSIAGVKNPQAARNWASKIQEIKDDMESVLNARMRRVRRTQTPF